LKIDQEFTKIELLEIPTRVQKSSLVVRKVSVLLGKEGLGVAIKGILILTLCIRYFSLRMILDQIQRLGS